MRTAWLQTATADPIKEADIETPAYVYDEVVLREDLSATREVVASAGARLLLAMKAMSFEPVLRLAAPWLDGLHASSAFEARLARRVFDSGIVHTTIPGLRASDLEQIVENSDRVSFNSLGQWHRFADQIDGRVSPGIRVNPGLSFVDDERYDPSARHSKLGVPIDDLASVLGSSPASLQGLEGILVHNNCESVDFRQLLKVVTKLQDRLDRFMPRLKWVNLGGGYLFADSEHNDPLREAVKLLTDSYGVEVLFEPGTGLVARAGSIIATVVDMFESGGEEVAVLDTSVSHAPEVLEFRFVPEVGGGDGCHPYLLAGASCLVGDTFGRHCMMEELRVGSRVTINDIGAYSLAKASWFNGIDIPTVYTRSPDGRLRRHKKYDFDDFLRFSGGAHEDH